MSSLLLLFSQVVAMAVDSVFGRSGAVVAAEGDYDLTDLGDVTISSPSDLQALLYNGTSGEWENATLVDSVAGADREIQFNDGGTTFGASSNFKFESGSNPKSAIRLAGEGDNEDIRIGGELFTGTAAGFGVIFEGTHGRGSKASPSATQANDTIFRLIGLGHDGTAVAAGGAKTDIVMRASGNWSSGVTPTEMLFRTTPPASSTLRSSFIIRGEGIVEVDANADGDVIRIKQGGVQEGAISVSGNTVTYGSFCGVHPTQPTAAQQITPLPPVGGVLVSDGDQIESELTVWVEPDGTDNRTRLQRVKDSVVNFFVGEDSEYLSNLKGRVYKLRLPDDLDESERVKFVKKTVRVANKEIYVHTSPTTTVNDKRVYGVFVGQVSDKSDVSAFGANNVPVWHIAGLGHYKVRVTDLGGNISNGDYLTSSTRAYEAQRQADDLQHSYTIGKALIDVDWNNVAVDPQLGYKWALIPATLHCG